MWKQGTQAWLPAGQVPELQGLFQATPPPRRGAGEGLRPSRAHSRPPAARPSGWATR